MGKVDAGASAQAVCRHAGISTTAYYKWRKARDAGEGSKAKAGPAHDGDEWRDQRLSVAHRTLRYLQHLGPGTKRVYSLDVAQAIGEPNTSGAVAVALKRLAGPQFRGVKHVDTKTRSGRRVYLYEILPRIHELAVPSRSTRG